MEQNSKINVYINSSFRNTDETVSNFKVVIPDELLKCNSNEYFIMNVTAFSVYNTFNQCNSNSNHFQFLYYNLNGDLYSLVDFYLSVGNPNVYDVMNNINSLIAVHGYITYDRITNKYTYYRTKAIDNNFYNLYINPVTAKSFVGFSVRTLIIPEGTVTTNAINVNTITAINITIGGDIIFKSSNIDNCYNKWHCSNIILQKFVDVPKNGLLKYENNDAGDSFNYVLVNDNKVKYFQLQVFDQNMNSIYDFPEYILTLQFEIIKKNEIIPILNNINSYIKEMYLIIGHILEYMVKKII